jgi:hypothetical protein
MARFMTAAFLTLSIGFPVHAAEFCGLLQVQGQASDAVPRFRMLTGFEASGGAFIDMETCLVWSLRPFVTRGGVGLNDALSRCADLGRGGSRGHMGWRLPTVDELTSLDTEQWLKQETVFDEYKLPPRYRSEDTFWTSTSWLSEPDSLATVQFSGRTTVVNPIKKSAQADVWCVRCCQATGVQ